MHQCFINNQIAMNLIGGGKTVIYIHRETFIDHEIRAFMLFVGMQNMEERKDFPFHILYILKIKITFSHKCLILV